MKRMLALILTVFTLLPLICSCGQGSLKMIESEAAETEALVETETENEMETEAETTADMSAEETEMIPQSPYEQSVTRILILGNSASNDVFFQLGRVFNAQGFGGKKYTLAFLYYSGCSFSQHVAFMNQNAAVYDYRKTGSTSYTTVADTTMQYALEDEQWDVILLHPGGGIESSDLQLDLRREIEAYVNEHVPTEHVFGFHMRCANPNDPAIWGEDWPVRPPAGYRERLEQYYNFDPVVQYEKICRVAKTHILTDPTYVHTISTASGVYYAQQVLGVAQTALYRDYTHLSDFGRVLTAYCFYAQFTGEPIDEVKLDMIPAKSRQKRYQADGDLVLTEELKHVIKESANYSLEHPWDTVAK